MTTRSTILALTTLATLSVAALMPTQASAWGGHGGGHGGGYGGYHYGGGYNRGYGQGYRYGGYGYGGGYVRSYGYGSHEGCNCEAPPAPVVQESYEAPPIIKKVYVPVEVPVEVRVPVRVPYRVEVPVPYRVEVPVHEEYEAPAHYVPLPAEENCNCEEPTQTRYPSQPAPRRQFDSNGQVANTTQTNLQR